LVEGKEAFKKLLFSKLVVELRPGNEVTYLDGCSKHPGQALIHFGEWMYFVAMWGRRTGKTIAAAAEVVYTLALPATRIWIVAPTYELTDRVFEYVYKWVVLHDVFKHFHGPGSIVKASNTRESRYIETKWGSFVKGKSAESPNSLIGEQLDLIVMDEAARIPQGIFTELLEPCTLDRKGRILFISTPRGKNWFWEYFERRRYAETKNKGWAGSQFKTADNPFIDREWLDSKRSQTPPDHFRREYEASPEHFAGLIWPMFRNRGRGQGGHLFNPRETELPRGTTYRAIDVGWRHPTYCLWGKVDQKDSMWLFREYKGEPSVVHSEHARNIVSMSGGMTIYDTWISPDAKRKHPLGDRQEDMVSAYDIYIDHGVDCRSAVDDVNAGISVVGQYLQSTLNASSPHPSLYISEDLIHLRKALENYVYQEPVNLREVDAPERPKKYKDDEADALRYLLATSPQFDRLSLAGEYDRYGYWVPKEEEERTHSEHRTPGAPRVPGFV